jgi:hypothetical protein
VWTPVWRILTPAQIRQKFAHLRRNARTGAGRPGVVFKGYVAEIQAEQAQRNAALHKTDHTHIPLLRIAERYVAGRPRARRRG